MMRLMAGTALIAIVISQAAIAQEGSQTIISPDGTVVTGAGPETVRRAADIADDAANALESAVEDANALQGTDVTDMIVDVTPPDAAPVQAPVPAPQPADVSAAPAPSPADAAAAPAPLTVNRLPPAPQPPVRSLPQAAAVVAPTVAVAQVGADPAVTPAEGEAGAPPVILAPEFNTASEIARRSELRREMQTIAVDMERLEALQSVVERIGVDNAVALYPDLAATIAYSPMGLEARKAEISLVNELREMMAPKEEPAESAPVEQAAVVGDPNVMNMTVGSPGAQESGMSREDVMAMIEEMKAQEQQEEQAREDDEMSSMSFQISEIYGTEGNMIAVLRAGSNLIKVREGDELPDGSVVTSVSTTGISSEFDGVVTEMKLR